jgi:hypothetical protein
MQNVHAASRPEFHALSNGTLAFANSKFFTLKLKNTRFPVILNNYILKLLLRLPNKERLKLV